MRLEAVAQLVFLACKGLVIRQDTSVVEVGHDLLQVGGLQSSEWNVFAHNPADEKPVEVVKDEAVNGTSLGAGVVDRECPNRSLENAILFVRKELDVHGEVL